MKFKWNHPVVSKTIINIISNSLGNCSCFNSTFQTGHTIKNTLGQTIDWHVDWNGHRGDILRRLGTSGSTIVGVTSTRKIANNANASGGSGSITWIWNTVISYSRTQTTFVTSIASENTQISWTLESTFCFVVVVRANSVWVFASDGFARKIFGTGWHVSSCCVQTVSGIASANVSKSTGCSSSVISTGSFSA